jgi:VanZ family protein
MKRDPTNEEEKAQIQHRNEREHGRSIYKRVLIGYCSILIILLLWPFDFGYLKKNDVQWTDDANGVIIDGGRIGTQGPCEILFNKILSGKGLSIELWVSPLIQNQSGPARILSYSLDPLHRNFTIAQDKNGLVVRLRTVNTDANGIPQVKLSDVFISQKIRHIIVTYDYEEEIIYIDGQVRLLTKLPQGRFDNWDPLYPLVMGNETTGNRPWAGRIYYAAIYNQPLDKYQVKDHFSFGWQRCRSKTQVSKLEKEGLIAKYCFDEGEGVIVHDRNDSENPIDIFIPSVIYQRNNAYLQSRSYLKIPETLADQNKRYYADIIMNLIIFIPMGFLIHGVLRLKYGISINIFIIVMTLCGIFSACIESVQLLSASRYSSMLDIVNNLIGTALGIYTDRRLGESFLKWLKANLK